MSNNGKFKDVIIASDMDGTYFGKTVHLVQRNVEAVKYFCENGGHFTFATGRIPIFIRAHMERPSDYINLPAVMGNGTCLYDFEREEAIEEHFIDTDVLCDIATFVEKLDSKAGFRGITAKGFAVNSLENRHIETDYYHLPDFMEKRIAPVSEWKGMNLYKMLVRDDSEEIDRLYPILKERFEDRVTVTRSWGTMIEIIPLGISKAVMLKKLVERIFDRPMMLCTVGDYDNDLEMHGLADLPVCPSNANDKVKAACKLCLCSNEEGVIADLVEYLNENL